MRAWSFQIELEARRGARAEASVDGRADRVARVGRDRDAVAPRRAALADDLGDVDADRAGASRVDLTDAQERVELGLAAPADDARLPRLERQRRVEGDRTERRRRRGRH